MALSRSEMLLISAGRAGFFCRTCSSDRRRATLRSPSALVSVALFSVVRLLCNTWQSDASLVPNSSCEQSPESVMLSNLSVLSTLTSVVSPSSGHACTHKCKSDMKFRNSPLSLLPPQFLGMRSLIQYGLEAVDFAETLWSAVLMLFNMSILPLTVSFISTLNCCITSVIS